MNIFTVLVYSGKLDFICNYFGGRAWTNATQWSGQVVIQTLNKSNKLTQYDEGSSNFVFHCNLSLSNMCVHV